MTALGDTSGVAQHLSALITCRTISEPDHHDPQEFARLRGLLRDMYPATHRATERIELPGGSLLHIWRGRRAERPLLLMAHHDVVPAEASRWAHDPFGGDISESSVHGRGALDDKGALVCLLEAVEALAVQDFVPDHDIYVFSGADEETDGNGARLAAKVLHDCGVRPWLVSDEGGAVVPPGLIPGQDAPIAMVALAEKGTVDVDVVARSEGGHSSVPLRGGATERLAEAVLRISRHEPQTRVSAPVRAMLAAVAEHFPPTFAGLATAPEATISSALSDGGPELAALIRSTMVVTRMTGSPADNVLATRASANVNARLAPGDDKVQLESRLSTLLDGLDISIDDVRGDDPSPTAAGTGAQWDLLTAAITHLDPDVRVVPYLQSGATDSRHFTSISDAVHRFSPLTMDSSQRAAIHSHDEHVTVESLARGASFYHALMTLPH
ncbi:M20/M25/M40 family metallo-hydrolase [Aeromicrobium fastidiosum]|uniref:M20/M25/M40 family metallo-hydrolase n=1 Tax=Aeromicrobium fastidiosum TaxID=52699 RepID=A0A641AMG5_9ACTN|nr:M20/M25/M40 family metallo-hydrolase [Aeromicrobium fastidiosum]KAA1378468.1 M20/M25/M40 family metallo-hydrolase [Aeromicrobium fastidiosum]MBP2392567.1 carboxypeptidase PM20D1 [Aeromicrobium fastidiosum]